ncbi:MAG: hypothetical protein ACJAVM_001882 [Sulfitobacter sp.]
MAVKPKAALARDSIYGFAQAQIMPPAGIFRAKKKVKERKGVFPFLSKKKARLSFRQGHRRSRLYPATRKPHFG